MRLGGDELRRLNDELRAAFRPNDLRRLLRYRLDRDLDELSLNDTYVDVVFDVVEAAEREDWLADVVAAAIEARPRNAELNEIAATIGLAAGPPRHDLERIIRASNGLLDVVTFRSRLASIEAAVCRVEIVAGRSLFGTGFLVAPDLVITNAHVAQPILPSAPGIADPRPFVARPDDVVLRFDFKQLEDGRTVNAGMAARLAPVDWLVDTSPPTDAERSGLTTPADIAPPDALDYALLRVGEPIGERPISPGAPASDPPRGWIPLVPPPSMPAPDGAIFIVQHPETRPMKVALDTQGVIGLTPNGTRLRYRTNTLAGSSGSPVFDQDWQLVAVHHLGEPGFPSGPDAAWNQGIPIAAIRALLAQRGLADVATAAPAEAAVPGGVG